MITLTAAQLSSVSDWDSWNKSLNVGMDPEHISSNFPIQSAYPSYSNAFNYFAIIVLSYLSHCEPFWRMKFHCLPPLDPLPLSKQTYINRSQVYLSGVEPLSCKKRPHYCGENRMFLFLRLFMPAEWIRFTSSGLWWDMKLFVFIIPAQTHTCLLSAVQRVSKSQSKAQQQ